MTPPYERSALLTQLGAGATPLYLFFWGHTAKGGLVGDACFSQWFPKTFSVEGQSYATAEHFMMAEKARLFGDDDVLAQILVAGSPGAAKALGRKVRLFDDKRWREERTAIVVRGNLAKFSQNEPLKKHLLKTGETVLVEAAPRDQIWGIGLGANNPKSSDPAQWRGLNLLGFALMQVRDALRA